MIPGFLFHTLAIILRERDNGERSLWVLLPEMCVCG